MYVIKDNCLRISIRNLVEFIYRSGDIEAGNGGMSDVRLMQEGTRIHKKIQKSMGMRYRAEVPLKIDLPSEDGYTIRLEGRADGIIGDLNDPEDEITVDEIKTVQSEVKKMKEPVCVHYAQAMCYAYIYAVQNELKEISVQLTYCNAETEEIKRFTEKKSFNEVENWFLDTLFKFKRWTQFLFSEKEKRTASIKGLSFPFSYREGQKNLVVSVYRSIEQSRTLYIQAPTGVGKTISTIYPAVQAMGQDMTDKIFYLTSKTITRTVAEDTFEILRNKGLSIRTVTLT